MTEEGRAMMIEMKRRAKWRAEAMTDGRAMTEEQRAMIIKMDEEEKDVTKMMQKAKWMAGAIKWVEARKKKRMEKKKKVRAMLRRMTEEEIEKWKKEEKKKKKKEKEKEKKKKEKKKKEKFWDEMYEAFHGSPKKALSPGLMRAHKAAMMERLTPSAYPPVWLPRFGSAMEDLKQWPPVWKPLKECPEYYIIEPYATVDLPDNDPFKKQIQESRGYDMTVRIRMCSLIERTTSPGDHFYKHVE